MKELTKIFNKILPSHGYTTLEEKIRSCLRKGLSPEEIFDKIKTHSNVEEVGRFLYNFGLDKTLFDFSVQQLKNNKALPWPYLLKLFVKYKIIPDKKTRKLLFHYWLKNKDNHSPSLFACKIWTDVSPEFQQMRFVYLKEMEEKHNSDEKDLLEQLEFVQVQGLIKEEEEIVAKLLLIDSKNKKYRQLKEALKEKKALLTIEEQKKVAERESVLENYIPPSSFNDSSLKEKWFKTVSLTAQKNPEETKNLALFLYFCAWPDKAVTLMEKHINKMSDYWFYLDWILETKQHTKGLEFINYLLSERKEGASFFLPLIYLKSQILYGLGKKNSAIEYLTAISQVQPDYKSTQYLLDKWLKNI